MAVLLAVAVLVASGMLVAEAVAVAATVGLLVLVGLFAAVGVAVRLAVAVGVKLAVVVTSVACVPESGAQAVTARTGDFLQWREKILLDHFEPTTFPYRDTLLPAEEAEGYMLTGAATLFFALARAFLCVPGPCGASVEGLREAAFVLLFQRNQGYQCLSDSKIIGDYP